MHTNKIQLEHYNMAENIGNNACVSTEGPLDNNSPTMQVHVPVKGEVDNQQTNWAVMPAS